MLRWLGMMTDVSQGEVDSKTFTVTSMCLKIYRMVITASGIKDGKITYQAHGAMNRQSSNNTFYNFFLLFHST